MHSSQFPFVVCKHKCETSGSGSVQFFVRLIFCIPLWAHIPHLLRIVRLPESHAISHRVRILMVFANCLPSVAHHAYAVLRMLWATCVSVNVIVPLNAFTFARRCWDQNCATLRQYVGDFGHMNLRKLSSFLPAACVEPSV